MHLNTDFTLHLLGIALQATAVVLAFRLMPVSGKRAAWLLLAAAFLLMGVRLLLDALLHLGMLEDYPLQLASTALAAAVSLLLVGGIFAIRPIFIELRASRQALEAQLDELRRFQTATVARELRMKQLLDENRELKHLASGRAKSGIGTDAPK